MINTRLCGMTWPSYVLIHFLNDDLSIYCLLQLYVVVHLLSTKSGLCTAPLFFKLKSLDILQINTLDIAKFMFRYHNNLLPPLFLNLFMTNSRVHRYDTRTAGNYCRHSYRMNIKKFTILYQGPRVWNCLLASITDLSSFATLKNKVLEFLLK